MTDGLLVEQFKIKQDPRVLMPVNLSEVQEIARVRFTRFPPVVFLSNYISVRQLWWIHDI